MKKYFGKTSSGSARILFFLLKVVGVLFIIFLLYKIVFHLMNGEGNWLFGRNSDNLNAISSKNVALDIHKHNLRELINEAVKKKDFRLAIRYSYLNTLKQLSNNEIIHWDSEKTNHDYFIEITDSGQKDQFQYISYLYNYCWYGEFEIDEEQFQEAKIAFNKMMEMI